MAEHWWLKPGALGSNSACDFSLPSISPQYSVYCGGGGNSPGVTSDSHANMVIHRLFVPLAVATDCVLYNREPLVLHCGGAFASCNYVSPVNNFSLLAAEEQLGDVIHLAKIAVSSGTLSQTCFDSFVSFYCHQVYALCEEDGAQNYVSTAEGLCQSYCEHVIATDCGPQAWSHLGNVIEQLLRNGIIQTPSLLQNCSAGSNNPDSCTPLLPGKHCQQKLIMSNVSMIGHKLLDDSKLFTLLCNNESISYPLVLFSTSLPFFFFFFVQKVRVILQTIKCAE